jgi:F5/8 type C domain
MKFRIFFHGLLCGIALAAAFSTPSFGQSAGTIRVDATPGKMINSFDPDLTIGSSIDVLCKTDIDKVYTPHVIQESISAGYGPITYRNNTELRIAAWHWNAKGAWSDPANQSGYWVSSPELGEPIKYILAYSLPHRGFTRSGGGASSTMQGKISYWKSNPYLSSKFTGESDALHPQWVVMDLGDAIPVSAIQIAWESPYAKTFQVDYWVGQTPLGRAPSGQWNTFPSGKIRNAQGGAATLKLTDSPVTARYLRVWMTESSNTCDEHGAEDVRNCVGYAIKEMKAGTVDASGGFTAAGDANKVSYTTSSVDPWHSEEDVNNTGAYQHTGFDILYTSGLTNNLPAMLPVTLLYGTPEDAANQIAYLKKRGYPLGWVEMGEEPDGKYMLPEDYGALYLQWATSVHQVDPTAKLGGPVFEGINEDIKVWPDAQGRTSWMGRFLDYLKEHGRLNDLSFVSLEHYPFEPCDITWKDLYREPYLMQHILDELWKVGVPKSVPIMVTESHVSWRLTGPMTTVWGLLWLADNIGSFFEGGGAAFYHSPIQPQPVQDTCLGPASWSNFIADRDYHINGYTAAYWAARMINFEWVAHRSGVHQMFSAKSDIKDSEGNMLVTSYALKRPDGNWSLLLINKDENNPHSVRVVLEDAKSKQRGTFSGPVKWVTIGSEQYVWKADGPNSYADPDGPPVGKAVPGGRQATYKLPKSSVTVLRGKVQGF